MQALILERTDLIRNALAAGWRWLVRKEEKRNGEQRYCGWPVRIIVIMLLAAAGRDFNAPSAIINRSMITLFVLLPAPNL